MSFKEAFERFKAKKKEEKQEFKSMERELRFKKKLEQKSKSPAQKESEFYEREDAKERLDKIVKQKRKTRENRLKELSNPFNKQGIVERNDLIGADEKMRWI
jgi:hypothetical protein